MELPNQKNDAANNAAEDEVLGAEEAESPEAWMNCFKPWCGVDGKPCIDCVHSQLHKPAEELKPVTINLILNLDEFKALNQLSHEVSHEFGPDSPHEESLFDKIAAMAKQIGVQANGA